MTRLSRWLRYRIHDQLTRRDPRRRPRRGPARDETYKAWIRRQPCCACGWRAPSQAAHVGSDGGMGQRASDYSAVPLCYDCHTGGGKAYHRIGRAAFEREHGIDFDYVCEGLFTEWSAR